LLEAYIRIFLNTVINTYTDYFIYIYIKVELSTFYQAQINDCKKYRKSHFRCRVLCINANASSECIVSKLYWSFDNQNLVFDTYQLPKCCMLDTELAVIWGNCRDCNGW
jgi:hypothetical protein